MSDFSFLAERLAGLRREIDVACQAAGRSSDEVLLLPVSKTFPVQAVRQAQTLGLQRFGENRVQELRQKREALGAESPAWVVIGPVQTNKARDVARYADELQTLDRIELAEALDRRLQLEGRGLDVLVQVKTAAEATKHGLAPDAVDAFLVQLARYDTLRVKGFMTVATQSDDPAVVRACFAQLRELRDRSLQAARVPSDATRLSMGMSGDFELAIAEGATELRIGSRLFGDRAYA